MILPIIPEIVHVHLGAVKRIGQERNFLYTCRAISVISLVFGLCATGCATAPSGHYSADAVCHAPSPKQLPALDATTKQTLPHPLRQVTHQETLPAPHSGNLFEGPTTIEELVAYALGNNPEIAATRSKARALISRVPQARSFDDPNLSTTVFLEQIQTAAGPQDLMLSLSQKIPWFGKRNARGEVAYHQAQVAFAELADAELRVIEQLKLAYYDLYFIEEAKAIYKELEPKIKDVIAVTRSRFETDSQRVGLESVYHAEITLHKLQITLAELEQARFKASSRLARGLHLPRGLGLDIQPQWKPIPAAGDVDSLVAMIEFCHPQLEANRQAVVRDEWSVTLAKREYYPDVNVGFNWHAIGESGLSPVANGRDAYSLTAGVNLPIYKHKRDAAIREARFKTAQSAQQFQVAWDSLRADVEQLHTEVVEHDRVLRILDENILRKAEQTFELSLEAYRVDRIGFQQLIDSYESLLRSQLDRLRHATRRAQATAQLERAVGCAVADWNSSQ
jgi:outer membrane protein TolC